VTRFEWGANAYVDHEDFDDRKPSPDHLRRLGMRQRRRLKGWTMRLASPA
jgi:hypothetical protein